MIFPSTYFSPIKGGIFNPYFGGFGHYNHPFAGAGYLWPGFTYPYNLQTQAGFARAAGFIA